MQEAAPEYKVFSLDITLGRRYYREIFQCLSNKQLRYDYKFSLFIKSQCRLSIDIIRSIRSIW